MNLHPFQRAPSLPPWRYAWSLCVALTLLTPWMRAPAEDRDAAPVTIVLTSDADVYAQLARDIELQLTGRRVESRTVLLENLPFGQVTAAASETYITVGTGATLEMTARLPADVPLLYCLADTTKVPGLLDRPRAYGVNGLVSLTAQSRLIREALPEAGTVGLLFVGSNTHSVAMMKRMSDAVPVGWQAEAVDLDRHDSFSKCVEELMRRKPNVIWMAPDPAVYNLQTSRSLMLEAIRKKVPIFGYSKEAVEAGALLGVHLDLAAHAQQAMELYGTLEKDRASGFPAPGTQDSGRNHVEPRYEVAVNLVVARRINVRLPQALVTRAAFVRK